VRFETAGEEESHPRKGNCDGDGIARAHRLANDQRREEQDPDNARVLQKNRVCRRRPFRGDDE
jgi:hypothetical protein